LGKREKEKGARKPETARRPKTAAMQTEAKGLHTQTQGFGNVTEQPAGWLQEAMHAWIL
jgi:hypothetical protein